VIVYLTHWFGARDRAKASSNFMCSIPLSFVIGSPFAGWVLGHRWLAVAGWRWLFVLEGLPSVALGIVAFFYLTDRPRDATWLTPAQKQWVEEELRRDRPAGAAPMCTCQRFGPFPRKRCGFLPRRPPWD